MVKSCPFQAALRGSIYCDLDECVLLRSYQYAVRILDLNARLQRRQLGMRLDAEVLEPASVDVLEFHERLIGLADPLEKRAAMSSVGCARAEHEEPRYLRDDKRGGHQKFPRGNEHRGA